MDELTHNPSANQLLNCVNQYAADAYAKEELKTNIFYNTYLPKERQKTTPKGFKLAIDFIVKQDLQCTLDCINFLLKRLTTKFASDSKKAPLVELVQKFQSQLVLPAEDKATLSLIEFLYKYLPLLQKIIDNPKKIELNGEDLKVSHHLASIWFEGLYLQLSVILRRQEIKHTYNAFNPVLMRPHPVEEVAEMITEGKFNALQMIGGLVPKEVYPILIVIIEEIISLTEKSDFVTINFLSFALQVLSDANEKQYVQIMQLSKLLNELKDHILIDLQKLVDTAKQIEVNSKKRPLFEELSLWFEGLYLHTYRNKNKRFDIEDKTLQGLSKGTLSKMKIASYYHLASLEIDRIIKKFDQTVRNVENETIETTTNTLQNSSQKIFKDCVPTELGIIHICKAEKSLKITVEVFPEKNILGSDIINGIHHTLIKLSEQKKNEEKKCDEENVWPLLIEAKFGSDEIKVNALLNAISYFEFSHAQKCRLGYLKDQIQTELKHYKSNTYFHKYLGSLAEWFLPRWNQDLADKTIANIEPEKDPQRLLETLFLLRHLLSNRQSEELFKRINKIILNAYTMLVNAAPLLDSNEGQLNPRASLFHLPQQSNKVNFSAQETCKEKQVKP